MKITNMNSQRSSTLVMALAFIAATMLASTSLSTVNAQLSGGSSCTDNPLTSQGSGCGSGAGGGSTISTYGGGGGSTQSGDFGGGQYNPETGTGVGCTNIPQRDQGPHGQQTCEGNTSSHP
jgi:hypothetical protein